MRVICHILLTELSYAVLPGKAIETVCSERAGNKLVKLALWSTHLFVWLLNKCLLTMSMKQLGIGRMVMSLEYTDQKNFSWNSNPLNRFMKSPGDILGDSEGQGSLACCSPWGRKELGMTERLEDKSQWFPFNLVTGSLDLVTGTGLGSGDIVNDCCSQDVCILHISCPSCNDT